VTGNPFLVGGVFKTMLVGLILVLSFFEEPLVEMSSKT